MVKPKKGNKPGVLADNNSASGMDIHFFGVGCVLSALVGALLIWAFAIGQLTDDQRSILRAAFPLASGFMVGSFVGAFTVKTKGLIPGVVATGTGGFGVWLLSAFTVFQSPPATMQVTTAATAESAPAASSATVESASVAASGSAKPQVCVFYLKSLEVTKDAEYQTQLLVSVNGSTHTLPEKSPSFDQARSPYSAKFEVQCREQYRVVFSWRLIPRVSGTPLVAGENDWKTVKLHEVVHHSIPWFPRMTYELTDDS